MEVQLRTKTMDDIAEIGPANHLGYEKKQESERVRRDAIPKGECIYFDEAYERGMKLLGLELSELDVNMFSAVNNSLINVILPQALRNIMPQIGNNLIINIKDTCVLSIIGTVELFYTTKGVAGALYTYFESFTIAMIIYFIMTFTCSRILRVLEHKMDGPDNYDLATADTLTHTSGMYSYRERKDDRE